MKSRITTDKVLTIPVLLLIVAIANFVFVLVPALRYNKVLPVSAAVLVILTIVLKISLDTGFFEKIKNGLNLVKPDNDLQQQEFKNPNEPTVPKELFTETLERISDAYVSVDTHLRYLYLNKKAGMIFNCEPGQIVGKDIQSEFPEDQLFHKAYLKALETGQYVHLEGYHPRYDLWLESRIYPSPGGLTIFFRDVTEQKKTSKKINKLNRLYLFISHINQMIARTVDEKTLFKDVCDIAIEIGEFKMAWIGLVDQTTKIFRPFLHEDMHPDYISTIQTLAEKDIPAENGLSYAAIREGRYIVLNDIGTNEAAIPWRAGALKKNYHSSITLPIKKFGIVMGTLNLYADTKNFFDAKEIALLEETTEDIAFALEIVEKEALRKKAEQAVLESERRYQTLAEVSPVGIFHTDASGLTTYVNPHWCQISGLTREEALGNGWLNAVYEEDKDKLVEGWEEATKVHEVSHSEYRFVHRDGAISWVLGQATPELNSEGQIAGYVGTITDITRRKKAEVEIKKANERFELIAKATNDVIWDWNLVTDELWVNNNYYSLFGYGQETFEGNITSWNSHLHPDDYKQVLQGIHQAIDSGKTHWNDEYRYFKKDGTIVFVYDRGFILHDEQKKPYRMMGSMQNVSELKKAQDEIIKEKNLSDSIINSLPGIFYLFNKAGKYLRWNSNFEKVTMYSGEEIRQLHPLDFFDEEQKELVGEKIAATFEAGEASIQASLISKTRVKTPYYFTGILIDYQGTSCLAGVGIDFTERVKAQQQIEKTSEQLRQLALHLQTIREEERKRIGREIHDELGQQLTAIKMDIAWIDKKIPAETTILKNKLKNVIQLLDGSNQSIRRILSELRPGILDDHGLLEAIQWLGRQFTTNTGVPVKYVLTETEIQTSAPVANCIFRVYQEAFTNITRYARASKVSTSIHIINDTIEITIADDGKGFDPASVQSGKSFGILGMKERVLSLGGKFELASSPGQGTKISIRLPVSVPTSNQPLLI